MAKIQIVEADLTNLPGDVILTFAAPLDNWFSGVDQTIKRRFGNHYHEGLRQEWLQGRFANSGDTVLVKGPGLPVLFVCDDPRHPLPLRKLLHLGLNRAFLEWLPRVILPVIRTDFALNLFDKGPVPTQQIERELIEALASCAYSLDFVVAVYRDRQQVERLEALVRAS